MLCGDSIAIAVKIIHDIDISKIISAAGTECDHVTKYLRKLEIRLKTYPREWLERSDEQVLANPRSLSEAGFYCSAWLHSTAWIKCFACSAHAGA